ncbi:unnamed protein product [Coccothraustes coccothraustes]
MRSAAPLPLLAASLLLPLLLPAAPAARGSLEPPAGNGSRPPAAPGPGNHSGARLSPVPAMLRDLSALKAAVIGACALTAALIACLLLRVFRSGKRIKKTRKYDIITTPAERVEMAPLNEEDDEDEDSTVFDVKYSSVERRRPARRHSAVEGPAEPITVKGEAFISAPPRGAVCTAGCGSSDSNSTIWFPGVPAPALE